MPPKALDVTRQSHILLFTYAAWGHTRPIANFAAKVVKLSPANITLLTSPSIVDKVHNEVGRSFGPGEDDVKQRIRIVSLASDAAVFNFQITDEPFREVYGKLLREESLACAVKGTVFKPIPPPTSVIMDFFGVSLLRIVRELSPSIKVYAWQSGATSAVLRLLGPKEKGGMGNLKPILEEMAAKTGKTVGAAMTQMLKELPGDVYHMPGLPPMYDYEDYPQYMPESMDEPLAQVQFCGHDFLRECDGVIQTTDASCDPGIPAMEEWQASFSPPRKVYNIGPQLPSGPASAVAGGDLASSPKAKEIVDFLESSLKTHGPKSVVYISFGTIFGPWGQPDKLWTVLDVLMESRVPFILAHASPLAIIPEDVAAKVKQSGVGILASWSPQQYILSHSATGWFVTHGGYNSAMEGLSSGIPMICWDFHADQPIIAATLSHTLNVAYQLFEVRTGAHALKPIHRTGKTPEGTTESVRTEFSEVLKKMAGPDGATKRANVEKIRDALAVTGEEGGQARQALLDLIDDLHA